MTSNTTKHIHNKRPTWFDLAHKTLDAYGWPHDITDDEILERLLALNLERGSESHRSKQAEVAE